MCISFHSHGRTDGIRGVTYFPGQENTYPSGRKWYSAAMVRVELGPGDSASVKPDFSFYMSVEDAQTLMEALGAVVVEHAVTQLGSSNESDEAAS